MERARLCTRPGCAESATATLSFHYGSRELWLDDIPNAVADAIGDGIGDGLGEGMGRALVERQPHMIDLCTRHADRISPPRGWTGEDRRRTTPPTALAAS